MLSPLAMEYVFAFMARGGVQATNAALDKLRAGVVLSVLEYNTLCGSAAVLQDLLTRQKRPTAGTFYDSTIYHGPITAYQGKRVQCAGYYPQPSGPPIALSFWLGLNEALRNLSIAKRQFLAPVAQETTGELFGFAGQAALAVIDPVFADPKLMVMVNVEQATAFVQVFEGARLALGRLFDAQAATEAAIAATGRVPEGGIPLAEASAAEVQANIVAVKLTQTSTSRTRMVQAGALVLGAVAGVAAAMVAPRAVGALSEYQQQRAALREASAPRALPAPARALAGRPQKRRGAERPPGQAGVAYDNLMRERMAIMRILADFNRAEAQEPGRSYTREKQLARNDLDRVNARMRQLSA